MRILIVEDNMSKRKKIKEKIEEVFGEVHIEEVDNIIEAKRKIKEITYDICFIDLQLPLRKGESPQKNGGLNLINDIENCNLDYNNPALTIVISEYEELLNEILKRKALTYTVKYEEMSIEWEEIIVQKLTLIKKAQQSKKKSIVFAVHGINTRGTWKNKFASVITENTDSIAYHPWDYGSFRGKIIIPYLRKKIVEDFKEYYDSVIYKGDYNEINVVAHSFGTYVVFNALKRYKQIKFNKIIFLGSPLKKEETWEELFSNESVNKVLFYICKKDWVLNFAKVIGLGDSGRKGFNKKPENMEYRTLEDGEHSDLFSPIIMKTEWLKFLLEKK